MKHRIHTIVRDPLAGILGDWFGLENGSARVLLALYQNKERASIDTIARHSFVNRRNVPPSISRIRRAGLPIPKDNKREGYFLSIEARRQVREAFANAMKLLGAEVPSMAEHQVLEDALGLNLEVPPDLGLTAQQARIFQMLAKTPCVHQERIYTVLYGGRNDPPSQKTIHVQIHTMRRKLAAHGLTIRTIKNRGYALERAA